MEQLLSIDVGGWLDRAVLLAGAIVVGLVAQRVVARLVRRALDATSLPSASIFVNIARVLVWAVVLLSVYKPLTGQDPTALVTALGVVSLAVSLGMQDTISNIISGVSIMLSRAVKPGDQVTIGGVTGEVTDVSWRSTTLRTRGGAVEVIPNSQLSSTAVTHVTDWTVGYCSVPLAVVPGADLDAVTAQVRETVARVLADELDPAFETGVVFTAFTAYGITGEVQVHVLPEVAFATAQDKVVRALAGASWLASAL